MSALFSERTARRRSRDGHLPAASAESGDFAVIVLADGHGLELLDHGQGALDVGRILRVICAAGLVIRAPLGGRPFLFQGLVIDRALERLRRSRCRRKAYGAQCAQESNASGILHDSPPLNCLLICSAAAIALMSLASQARLPSHKEANPAIVIKLTCICHILCRSYETRRANRDNSPSRTSFAEWAPRLRGQPHCRPFVSSMTFSIAAESQRVPWRAISALKACAASAAPGSGVFDSYAHWSTMFASF